MSRRDRRAQEKEERRAQKAQAKTRLPIAPNAPSPPGDKALVVRRLVRDLVLHRARGHEGTDHLPLVAAAAAIEAIGPAMAEKFEEEPRPACKKGCAYCCHLHVAVTIPELLLAVGYARETRDAAGLEALAARAKGAADLARGTTPLTYPMPPCAFLGEDGACTIYPARPLACRGHHSFDVEACRQVFETKTDRPTPKRETLVMLGNSAGHGLRDALGELRLDNSSYELNQALDVALRDPGAGARWRKGEEAFSAARATLSVEEARVLGGAEKGEP
ncbi:MAG TPA: YkgJ family cysteine cluster protein [Polyangiaceae bacterium]